MSVMCCPLEGDCDDYPSFHDRRVRRAAKAHDCSECGEPIERGARYEHVSGKWADEISTYRTCLSCVEIRDHFNCNGFLYGQLWSDLTENFFPDMRAGGQCMDGLSPAAKSRLFDLRIKWMFESEEERDGARPPWHPPLALSPWLEVPSSLGRPAPELHNSDYLEIIENQRHHDDIQRTLEIGVQLRQMFADEEEQPW